MQAQLKVIPVLRPNMRYAPQAYSNLKVVILVYGIQLSLKNNIIVLFILIQVQYPYNDTPQLQDMCGGMVSHNNK